MRIKIFFNNSNEKIIKMTHRQWFLSVVGEEHQVSVV